MGQRAFDSFRGKMLNPPASVDLGRDEEIDAWVRSKAQSAYHLSCSLAMGKVVDEGGKGRLSRPKKHVSISTREQAVA